MEGEGQYKVAPDPVINGAKWELVYEPASTLGFHVSFPGGFGFLLVLLTGFFRGGRKTVAKTRSSFNMVIANPSSNVLLGSGA